uniref:40S ribosomal protein S7 n=1 Tax=Caenorhabditis tropicalis TaxID=1561998 RepID=A0A1I7U4G5_9PELO
MNQLGDAIPWKLSFFPTWTSWDLMPMWRRGVASEVEKWKKRRIAVVPITEVMETFDTNYTIPRKVRHLKNAVVVHPDQESEKLVHGLTEIVKNSLLGKRDRQLEVTATPRNLQYLSLFLD